MTREAENQDGAPAATGSTTAPRPDLDALAAAVAARTLAQAGVGGAARLDRLARLCRRELDRELRAVGPAAPTGPALKTALGAAAHGLVYPSADEAPVLPWVSAQPHPGAPGLDSLRALFPAALEPLEAGSRRPLALESWGAHSTWGLLDDLSLPADPVDRVEVERARRWAVLAGLLATCLRRVRVHEVRPATAGRDLSVLFILGVARDGRLAGVSSACREAPDGELDVQEDDLPDAAA